jgi:hypothetical protein
VEFGHLFAEVFQRSQGCAAFLDFVEDKEGPARQYRVSIQDAEQDEWLALTVVFPGLERLVDQAFHYSSSCAPNSHLEPVFHTYNVEQQQGSNPRETSNATSCQMIILKVHLITRGDHAFMDIS